MITSAPFFKTGFQQQHSLSFEGGNAGTTFRLSGSYLKNEGVVPSSSFTRTTMRLSSSTKISSKLNLQAAATYTNSLTDKVSKGAGSYFVTLMYWPKDSDVSDYLQPNGSRKTLRGGSYTSESDNPFWDVNKNNGEDKTNRLQGSVNLSYEPAKWVTLNAIAGYDGYTTEGYFASNPQSLFGSYTNGFISLYDQMVSNLNYQGRITLRKKWGDFSNTLLAGFNIDDYRTKVDAFKGEQFYESEFLNINNTKPETRDARTSFYHSRNVRFFSNYNLNYKYLNLSLGYTTEGDSRLTSKFYTNKTPWFDYGSVGANVVLTDIPQVADALPWLTFAKLRYNYATTGKSVFMPYAIDFSFVSNITTGGGYALGVTGGNQNLRPEHTKQQDMGLEMKFLKNRLGIDFTYYSLRSSDQILAARSSYLTGYVLKFINGGLVENRGLEIQLTGTPIQTKDFNWDITLNFDRNIGEIKEMPKDLPFIMIQIPGYMATFVHKPLKEHSPATWLVIPSKRITTANC